MKYILMHEDIPVLECEFNEGYFVGCGRILDNAHLPIGMSDSMFGFSRQNVADWFSRRSIPRDRKNLNHVDALLYHPGTQKLMLNNYACNLSDHYWMKTADSDACWADVNFFENTFSKELCGIIQGVSVEKYEGNAVGPDSATHGSLVKAWRILENGHRALVKQSSALHQEPYNEVIGSRFSRMVGIKSAHQTLIKDDTGVYSCCDCMVDRTTEMVSAWDIQKQYGKDISNNPVAYVNQYRKILKDHGISDKSVDDMICVDWLMRNTDRHWSNFGIIRNAQTLEWIEPIPLFDFGNSLWHDDLSVSADAGRSALTGMSLQDDLRLVKTCYMTADDVDVFRDVVTSVLSNAHDVNQEHREKIVHVVDDRIDIMKRYFSLIDTKGCEKGHDIDYGTSP